MVSAGTIRHEALLKKQFQRKVLKCSVQLPTIEEVPDVESETEGSDWDVFSVQVSASSSDEVVELADTTADCKYSHRPPSHALRCTPNDADRNSRSPQPRDLEEYRHTYRRGNRIVQYPGSATQMKDGQNVDVRQKTVKVAHLRELSEDLRDLLSEGNYSLATARLSDVHHDSPEFPIQGCLLALLHLSITERDYSAAWWSVSFMRRFGICPVGISKLLVRTGVESLLTDILEFAEMTPRRKKDDWSRILFVVEAICNEHPRAGISWLQEIANACRPPPPVLAEMDNLRRQFGKARAQNINDQFAHDSTPRDYGRGLPQPRPVDLHYWRI